MKIITEIYKEPLFKNKSFDLYFKNMKYGVFDIECTGLSPKNNNLILAGFVIPTKDGHLKLKQFFAESLEDESDILMQISNELKTLDIIITYNGASFDIPFLLKRLSKNNISSIELPYNIDLYKLVKNFSDIKNFLPNLKQKSLENFMGYWNTRADEIDGAESVKLYYDYLSTKNDILKQKILLHNSDDVKQLYRLMNVINKIDFHRAMFTQGFLNSNLVISKINIKKSTLIISGKQLNKEFKYRIHAENIYADFNGETFSLYIDLICYNSLTFIDLKQMPIEPELFKNSGGLHGNYLILKNNDNINYLATNIFTMHLLERILNNELY